MACASLEVSVRLMHVFVVLMYCLVMYCWSWMAFAIFMVCVSAVFESEIMIVGCPDGVISCAIMIAMSSAVLMHMLVVPMACGIVCMHVRSGVVRWLLQSCLVCLLLMAVIVAAAAALCLRFWCGGLWGLYDASVAMMRGEL